MQLTCEQCEKKFEAKSDKARYCSAKCRKAASRDRGPVERSEGQVEVVDRVYRFRTYNRRSDEWSKVRTARSWVDVPLAGEPVKEKGWPDKPEWMDNRTYFLWWDNNFEVNDKDEPRVRDPRPNYDKLTYEMGGDSARRWGS